MTSEDIKHQLIINVCTCQLRYMQCMCVIVYTVCGYQFLFHVKNLKQEWLLAPTHLNLCGFEWSDTVNWCMVERCTQNLRRDGSISRGTSHATTKERYQNSTSVDINNTHCKRLQSLIQNHTRHVRSESAREQRTALHKKLWIILIIIKSKTKTKTSKQTNKSKNPLFIMTKHNMRILSVSPFFKLQNNIWTS